MNMLLKKILCALLPDPSPIDDNSEIELFKSEKNDPPCATIDYRLDGEYIVTKYGEYIL
ncbi:TPA: hypothetical protein H1V70_004939 [Salmonella enterica]|nr:hypothetical protein [Salmonella enterica]HBC0040238.1 hypothetical protein [Salmonella enterica]